MSRLRAFLDEWRARRAGRHAMQRNDFGRMTRDVSGPMGTLFSNGWDALDEHRDAYKRSFDPKVPPSIWVSERDRTRHGQPMPLVERCIEDWEPSTTDT